MRSTKFRSAGDLPSASLRSRVQHPRISKRAVVLMGAVAFSLLMWVAIIAAINEGIRYAF